MKCQLAIVLLFLFFEPAFSILSAQPKAPVYTAQANQGFAVAELFTSEGCSSCPPADGALAKVSAAYGPAVYVLEFHVDYWNRLGWKDVFSNAAFSRRQQAYSRHFNLSSVYTPQVIINGKTEFTGSDEKRLHESISRELTSHATAWVKLRAIQQSGKVAVHVSTSPASSGVLNIALVQLKAQSQVMAGENAGRLLKHTNIVRDFIQFDIQKLLNGAATLQLPPHANGSDYRIIAYLQQPGNGVITGAAACSIENK